MTFTIRSLAAALAVPLALALPGASAAQDWPTKPLHLIVPYAPGSTGETVGRLIGEAIGPDLGQSVVVEAKPGGAGTVGTAAVVGAKPDGYTLLLGATNNFVISQFLMKQPFDPLKDLAPITKVVVVPPVIVASPTVPAKTLKEFVDYAKAHPGELNFSSPGIGTTPHLGIEQLKQMAGIDVVHVPYAGGGPAVTGLLSNEVQLYMGGSVLVKPHVDAGKMVALAVGTAERLPSMPDVPTTAELGYPELRPANWWGLAAPAGTPPEVIDRLQKAVADALKRPEVASKLEALGFVAVASTPADFAAELPAEAEVWRKVITDGGIKIE